MNITEKTLLCLVLLAPAPLALTACGDDEGDDDDAAESGDESNGDGGGADDGDGGDGGGPLTAVMCETADDRIDPGAAQGWSNDDFVTLGEARTGRNGRGTQRTASQERFVSAVHGDDGNDGSSTAPWRTLQHAADSVDPDTVVYVDDSGEYQGGLSITRGGDADGWVIFKPDGDVMPRIVGAAGTTSVVEIDASWVVFEGFEVTDHEGQSLDDDAIGIAVEPQEGDIHDIEIRNNVVHAIGPGVVEEQTCYYNAHGIIVQSEGHLVSNLVVDGNEIHDLYVGNSEVLVVNGNVRDFCVTNNYVHDVNNIAIDIIGYEKSATETTEDGVIADNVVLDASNYWPYCTRGNCTYPEGDESSDGIYVDGGARLLIEYNVVGRADHGIELQSENGELIREVEVAHNVVFNSNYKNFTLGDSEASFEHDNVFFDDPALADETLESCKP